MTNPELAARCLTHADAAMRARRVNLVLYAALSETTSLAAARRVLADWERGPQELRNAAAALLDELTNDFPVAKGAGEQNGRPD